MAQSSRWRGGKVRKDEEYTGRPRSAVIPDNVSAIRKILMGDNCCTYQMIQKELNIGSTQPYTKLFMKNCI
ncbi:UNVERIFIED_CONTAM: hypothetical protein NCL1_58453 [Trichonephila clavipes]